jgi:hypothetical protein
MRADHRVVTTSDIASGAILRDQQLPPRRVEDGHASQQQICRD